MSKHNGNHHEPPDPTDGLPSNLDAERFVLGSILLDSEKHLPAVRAALEPIDFSLEKHRRIYRRILELDQRGEKVDRVTVAEELKRHRELASVDGLSYLVSLDDGLPQIPNIDSYIAIVKDKAVSRRVIDGANALLKRALAQQETGAEVAEAGAEFFDKLAVGSKHHQEPPPAVPSWPEPLAEDAYHGVAGDLVRAIEPHSEADIAALLVQFLVGWGNMAGRGPYYLAEADHHHTNESAVTVGTTAKGRKGTSLGRVQAVLSAIDPHWAENRLFLGLGSGEAMIDAAKDEGDRRIMVVESEFARLLAVVSREGSTISANLRNAWDTGTLAINTRQNKVKVSGAHLSLIGHITREELLRRLDSTETANGFGNRKLWVCAKRSKVLPFGGGSIEYGDLIGRLRDATTFTRQMGNTRVNFDKQAAELWVQVYEGLSEGRPGMLGSMTSRAEAHVVRLSLIYALLDCAEKIRVEHLRAALGIWKYCAASARFIWGDALGDPTADEILRALSTEGDAGLTRWDLNNHFGRNKPAAELDRAIGVLMERGLIRSSTEDTGGRSSTRYRKV
jgi:hypothetical protein